jgi:hypothetical protein
MMSRVGRLQSQETTARLSQFIRSCFAAAAVSLARTCFEVILTGSLAALGAAALAALAYGR